MSSNGVSAKWQNDRFMVTVGHPRSFRACSAASALPQHEKYRCVAANRRSGPKATMGDLFNDLVGHGKNLRRQIEAERFRGFKIDHELKLGCLQHW